jgi:hypothetical protein
MNNKIKIYSCTDQGWDDDGIYFRNNDFEDYEVLFDYNHNAACVRMMHCVWEEDDQSFAVFLQNVTVQIFKYMNKE